MKNMLSVSNLTFGYDEEPVLQNVSLEVKDNEIVLVEGSNGAGKTTLLKCISGILNNGKNVYIDGNEIFKSRNELKKLCFVMSEDFLYDYLTMDENIAFFKSLFEEDDEYEKRVLEYAIRFNIMQYRKTLVKNLSQGTRNKLYLSVMLCKKHDILILDEPFTALDKENQEKVLDIVKSYKKKSGKSVIMVTHIDEFKKIATKEYTLERGN